MPTMFSGNWLPTDAFILNPSGENAAFTTFAPYPSKTFDETSEVAPFAMSIATVYPSRKPGSKSEPIFCAYSSRANFPALIARGENSFLVYDSKSIPMESTLRSMSSWKASSTFLALESKNFMPLSV